MINNESVAIPPKAPERIEMTAEIEKLLKRDPAEYGVVKLITVKAPTTNTRTVLFANFMISLIYIVCFGAFFGPAIYFGIRFVIDDYPAIGWILIVVGIILIAAAVVLIIRDTKKKGKVKKVKPAKTYVRIDDPYVDKIKEETTPENLQFYMNLTSEEIDTMTDPTKLYLIARILLAFHGVKWTNPGAFMQYLKIESELPIAIMCLEKSLRINPDNYQAWNNLGYAHMELMDFDVAIEKYNKSIELNPNFDIPWFNIGVVYGRKNQHEKVIDYYWKAIQINPHSANYWAGLGLRLFFDKEDELSIKCYQRAVELEPDQEHFKKDLEEIEYKIQKRNREEQAKEQK